MAQVTLQNNIVTAKKFVQIGSDSVSARKKLASVLTSYEELNNKFNIIDVEKMISDETITPDEKDKLKERWDVMETAYLRLVNTLETEGLLDLEGVDAMRIAYSTLFSLMQNVLADMDSTSKVPNGFQAAIEEFNTRFNFVAQMYSALAYKIQAFRLRLETEDYYLDYGKTATVTAKLYKGADEYKGDEEESIFSSIVWRGEGLKNAVDTYIDGRSIKVPYTDFEQTFYVSATVSLPIAIL